MYMCVGERHFGMYSVGESVNIKCADPDAFLVSWINSTGEVISYGLKSATLTINSITDGHHGHEYTCRIKPSSETTRDFNYTIIIISRSLLTVVAIIDVEIFILLLVTVKACPYCNHL